MLDALITQNAELAARLGIATEFAPVRRFGSSVPPAGWLSGYVRLTVTVRPDGRVADAVVTETDLPDAYREAAVKTVTRWRYMPATRNGQAIAAPLQFTLRYSVQ